MIDRRTMIAGAGRDRSRQLEHESPLAQAGMSRITAYAFSFPALAGGDIRLAEYAGRPMLIVNTASLCGFTPQYAGLQELWTEFHDRGLMIIGVPSNDFGGQEPGGATEIAADRAASIWRYLSDRGQGRREGSERASVLQMGRRGAAEGCSALELPQIPDRPRRLYRRSLPRIASNRRIRASKPPSRGRFAERAERSRNGNASKATSPELTGPADKSAGRNRSRCVGGAAPTRLL